MSGDDCPGIGVLPLIPDGAPSFIVLVLCTAMMALIVAQMNFLSTQHLLSRPMFGRRLPRFKVFHYNVTSLLAFLVAQFIGLFKIIIKTHQADNAIMTILIIGNISVITFVC